MNPRPYQSSRRAATAEQTRARLLEAACAMLASPDVISLDAVARKAGVTRLTVYNQFGSRRSLLEAVFDHIAVSGGLHRVREAMTNPDPHAALRQIVSIFCDFWGGSRDALWRLNAASATDPEFEESLGARHERRRNLLSVLVGRMTEGGGRPPEALAELVDVLFALTGIAFYRDLTARGLEATVACRIIQTLAADAVQGALAETGS
jgi:AcrR family transcriptional regulator